MNLANCTFRLFLQDIKNQIIKEYHENKKDLEHQRAKRRFDYLHGKLSHIKGLVFRYDQGVREESQYWRWEAAASPAPHRLQLRRRPPPPILPTATTIITTAAIAKAARGQLQSDDDNTTSRNV